MSAGIGKLPPDPHRIIGMANGWMYNFIPRLMFAGQILSLIKKIYYLTWRLLSVKMIPCSGGLALNVFLLMVMAGLCIGVLRCGLKCQHIFDLRQLEWYLEGPAKSWWLQAWTVAMVFAFSVKHTHSQVSNLKSSPWILQSFLDLRSVTLDDLMRFAVV